MKNKSYLIIDLKSFYASCESVMRRHDPRTTDLVVADAARGRGTICLAVSPSLKAKGVRNRCRVFEIPSRFRYIMATPRMQLYLNYAAEIYSIYLDYFCKNDIFVYSVDEAFIDITGYTQLYHKTPHEMARFLLCEIEQRLGLPASCGIGTNLYLAKIALDITAKHAPDRIGRLDEETFRRTLWQHTPLTDFWRIGHGISAWGSLRWAMSLTRRTRLSAKRSALTDSCSTITPGDANRQRSPKFMHIGRKRNPFPKAKCSCATTVSLKHASCSPRWPISSR